MNLLKIDNNSKVSPLFRKLVVSVLFVGSLLLVQTYSPSTSAVWIFWLAIILGASLNYLHFGFSSSFRRFFMLRETLALRAMIWMLVIALILFSVLLNFPLHGQVEMHGLVRPVGLAVITGAFIFGMGMQLGCGCTSGTLNRLGQFQPLALPTLAFMVIGGTFAAASFEYWRYWPAFEPVSLTLSLGIGWGLGFQLLGLYFLYRILLFWERRHLKSVEPIMALPRKHLVHPWLLAGMILASANAGLLWISGSPWSISSIFPYWGLSAISLLDLPVDWEFWDYAMENQQSLARGFLGNTVSLTTLGVLFGALLVTLVRHTEKQPCMARNLFASMIAGFMMGFGAMLASGCNIGAFFSGIASSSLHGWIWLPFALLGNWIGLKIRLYFRLSN